MRNHKVKQVVAGVKQPRKDFLRIEDGVNAYEITPDDLITTITHAKARPEAFWAPSHVRYVDREYVEGANGTFEEVYIVITEQAPSVRTVKVQKNFEKFQGEVGNDVVLANYDLYNLSFPYVINLYVFRVEADGCIVLDPTWALSFYRTLPLSGFSDELYICNLPNVTVEPWNPDMALATVGWTCFHNAPKNDTSTYPLAAAYGHSGESGMSAVTRLTDKITNYAWSAIFTASEDTLSAWLETKEKVAECSSMEAWQESTEANPDFVLYADWVPHPERATLGEVVEAIHEALNVVTHPGFEEGEEPTLPNNNKVSMKRFKAMMNRNWPRKKKFF